MALLLRDLLAEPSLGLQQVSGDTATLRRPLAGAHAIEIAEPTRWLARGWVLLTTGLRLRGDTSAQRALIREAAEGRLAAIAFGEGVVFRKVPPAMLAEARTLGFPLLTVDPVTPFREIVGYVERALASDGFRALKQRLDIETSLVDSLASEDPEQALVRRLGSLVDAAAVLYRPNGRVASSVGAAPLEAIWRELARDPACTQLTVGRWQVVIEPVLAGDDTYGLLALGTRQQGGVDDLMRAAARSAARLLGVVDLAREAIRVGERTIRAELLDLLLEPTRAAEVPDERLQAAGFDPRRDLRVALVEVTQRLLGGASQRAAEFSRAERTLEVAAQASGAAAIVARRRGRLAVLFQERERDAEGWVARLAAAGFAPLAGIGRPFRHGGRGAVVSLRDAELALDQVRRSGGAVLRYEDLGIAEWLLASADPSALDERSSAWLAPVRGHAELFRTLLVHLDSDLNVQTTAAALHLHENSLRYRLKRIEGLLGASLRELPTLVDLHLATAAERTARRGAE